LVVQRWFLSKDPALLQQAIEIYQPIDQADRLEDNEDYVYLILALYASGRQAEALATLERAYAKVDPSAEGELNWLNLIKGGIECQPLDELLAWFGQKGFNRVVRFGQKLQHALALIG
jgi:tetratricopeptide (TPR) repeat protein